MREADKIKIRKWRQMIAKEFDSPYENTFQEIRKNKRKDKYKDPAYWKEESDKSLKKILDLHR